MVNNTVNGKKIGTPAGKDDKVKFIYSSVGKRSQERGIDAKVNAEKSQIPIIDDGDIVAKTGNYVAIRAYPGGKNEVMKNKEDMTH